MSQRLTIDFFHDVVCGWCFNISPRLRVLATEFDLEVRHRTFVLQDSPAQMVAVFGSLPRAKEIILDHWVACQAASDTPECFNVEGMRRVRLSLRLARRTGMQGRRTHGRFCCALGHLRCDPARSYHPHT